MHSRPNRAGMPANPLLQVVTLVLGAVVTVGAVFLGAILLSLFLGLAVIAGLVLYIRLWWLRRRAGSTKDRGGRPGEFVEVEYTVVGERTMRGDTTPDRED
ncbi:MAG TPA: hypothetical protein VLD39_15365 [Gammaproteobacteria bacterium]|nr:hypothetical protein [Gammaproteobacteria bacterium]